MTKISNQIEINFTYNNKLLPTSTHTKFLSLTVDHTLPWINHIDQLSKRLSSTCYLITNIKPYLSLPALNVSYQSLFHSIMSNGIMFWGHASHSSAIFKVQKRVIRILMGLGYRESCRESFKKLKILTLSSQYIFSLLLSVVNNRGCFVSNNEYHNIN